MNFLSLYVLGRETMEAHLMQQLQQQRGIFDLIDKDFFLEMMVLATLLSVACWWGFALYVYVRRSYFRA